MRAGNAHGWSGWRNSAPAGPSTLAQVPAAAAEQSAPGTPSEVTVTRGDGTVSAAWPSVAGATKYHVVYSSDNANSWTAAAGPDDNHAAATIDITGTDATKSYIVGVRAGNAHGWSGWRNSDLSPGVSPPAPPGTVTVSRANGTLTASWDAPAGATKYHVTYSSNNGSSWTAAAGPDDNHTGADITIAADDALAYIVAVRAGKDAGGTTLWSAWRNSGSSGSVGPPAAPAQVSTQRVCDTKFSFSWTPVPGATGYDLVASYTNRKHWQRMATNTTATSGEFTSWQKNKTYYLAVRARNAHGTSGWTNSPAAPAPNCWVGTPANPKATTSTAHGTPGGAITATWDAGNGATAYNVNYRAGGQWTRIASDHSATTHTGTVTDTTATAFAVQSIGNGTTSQWRNANIGWLTADSVGASGTTLNLEGHSEDWYLKRTAPTPGTCSASAVNGNSHGLSTLAGGVQYTYTAYNDSTCTAAIGSATFTISTALAVSDVAATTATLTIAAHSAQWWYKADTGPDATCQGPVDAGTRTKDLTGLAAGTSYTYAAYSATGCAAENLLATAPAFTTPASLAVSNVANTTATLTIAGHTGEWHYKADKGPDTACSTAVTDVDDNVAVLAVGTTYTYTAYSDSACTTALASVRFPTLPPPISSIAIDGRGNGTVTMSWAKPAGVVSYDVEYQYGIEGGGFSAYADCPDSGVCVAAAHVETGGTHALTVSGLTNATAYKFRVSPRNSSGAGTSAQSPEARAMFTPGGLSAVTVDTRGDRSVTLSWPEPTGNYISGYDVQCTSDNGVNWTAACTRGTGSTASRNNVTTYTETLTGLTNATVYKVRARANNAVGSGPWTVSNSIAAISTPARIAAVTAARSPATSVAVSWTEPTGDWLSYDIAYSTDSGTTWTNCTASLAACTRGTGAVTSGTYSETLTVASTGTYYIRARARNGLGTTLWRESAALAVPSVGPPRDVNWNPGNVQGGTVLWKKPADTTGAVGYDLQVSTDSGATWGTTITITPSTSATRSQGLAATINAARVRSTKTGFAKSDWAYWPERPDRIAAVSSERSAGTVTLSWTIPSPAPTGYDIQYRVGGTGNYTNCAASGVTVCLLGTGATSGTAYTVTASGMSDSSTYQVRVRAKNAAGAGDWRESTLIHIEPARISALTVTRDSGELDISWTVPSANSGGAITGYDVQCSDDDGSTWTAACTRGTGANTNSVYSETLTGVANATAYKVRARARNANTVADWRESASSAALTLTATSVATTTATLSVASSYSGPWWYQGSQPGAACTSVASGTYTAALASLAAGASYTYRAYSDSGCTALITTGVEFTMKVTASSLAQARSGTETAGNNGEKARQPVTTGPNGAGYTLDNVIVDVDAVNGSPPSLTLNVTQANPYAVVAIIVKTGVAAGQNTFACVAGGFSTCILKPNTKYHFEFAAGTLDAGNNYALEKTASTTVALAPSGNGFSFHPLEESPGGITWNTGTEHLKVKVAATPKDGLTVTDVKATRATLAITGYTDAWYYKGSQSGSTCTSVAAGTATAAVTGLASGTSHMFKAYSDSACSATNVIATATAFSTPTPTLTGAGTSAVAGTLTLGVWEAGTGAGKDGTWHYKADAAPYTACSSAAQTGQSVSLSGLTPGLAYTFKAYSDSSCANEIAAASAFKPLNIESVSNLSATDNTSCRVGYSSSSAQQCATSFTTGSATEGYTLESITPRFRGGAGTVTGFKVALHTVSNGKPSASAVANVTFTGAAPSLAGNSTPAYACAGTGCRLSPATEYYVVMTATNTSGTHYYSWQRTSSDSETKTPSTNGWSIGNSSRTGSTWGTVSARSGVMSVTATANLTLKASKLKSATATLTITGHAGAWYYKANAAPDTACTTVAAGTSTVSLTGLTQGTSYTYKAYIDSACAREFASVSFSPATLTASSIEDTKATLTITGHTGSWYYKATTAPHTACSSSAVTGTSVSLTGLTAGDEYIYTAYTDSACATAVAEAGGFVTPVSISNLGNTATGKQPVFKGREMSTAFITGSHDTAYTLSYVTVDIHSVEDSPGNLTVALHSNTISGKDYLPSNTAIANATFAGANPTGAGQYTYTCSGSGCELDPDTRYHVVFSSVSGDSSNRYQLNYSNSPATVRRPAQNGWQMAKAAEWSGSTWHHFSVPSYKVKVAAVPDHSLEVSDIRPTTATLTIDHHAGPWWYKANTGPDATCQSAGSGTTAGLTGLTLSTSYAYKAYSASGCATSDEIASVTFTALAVLGARDITGTKAELVIEQYSSAWWYKADKAPDNSCKSAGSVATKALTGLSGSTSYTYTAYSNATCATKIAEAAFITLGPVIVSNLAQTKGSSFGLGNTGFTGTFKWATSFTTGTKSANAYTLEAVTVSLGANDGTPTGLTASVYTDNGSGRPGTLVKSLGAKTPAGNSTETWQCADSGNACILDKNTTYFLVLEGAGASNNHYTMHTTASDNQTVKPSTEDWTIGNGLLRSTNGGAFLPGQGSNNSTLFSLTARATELIVTNVDTTSATLNIHGYKGTWYYKADAAPHTSCSSAVTAKSKNLTGLSTTTEYHYTAYTDSACTAVLARAYHFTTPYTVSNLTATSNGYTAVYAGNKVAGGFVTGEHDASYTLSFVTVDVNGITGAPGDLTVTLYSSRVKSNDNVPNTAITTLEGANPTGAGNWTFNCTGAACELDPNTSYHFEFKSTGTGNTNAYLLDQTGLDAVTRNPTGSRWNLDRATEYQNSNWRTFSAYRLKMKVAAIPGHLLFVTNVKPTTATLNIDHHSGPWWYQADTGPHTGCSSAGTGKTADLTGLTLGTSYTYKAYDKAGCSSAYEMAEVTFEALAGLAASSITNTGATLTISDHTGAWWYKADKAPDNTCKSAGSVATKALTVLTASTGYVYKAYNSSTCATKIAEVAFSTTGPHTVSNLDLTKDGTFSVGNTGFTGVWKWANSFRTGENTGGYTLNDVVVSLGANDNSPTGLTAKIFTSDSGGHPGTLVKNLGTVTPGGGSNQTWTCTGSGCDLSADTTYLLVLEGTGGSNNHYTWNRSNNTTAGNGQTNTPANADWRIGDNAVRHNNGAWSSGPAGSRSGLFSVTATPK